VPGDLCICLLLAAVFGLDGVEEASARLGSPIDMILSLRTREQVFRVQAFLASKCGILVWCACSDLRKSAKAVNIKMEEGAGESSASEVL